MNAPAGFDGRKAQAADTLSEAIRSAKRPVILSSYGKESLCLLALAREIGASVDIAYFELGALPQAHKFARRAIAASESRVTLLRPHRTFAVAGAAGADLAYEFRLGNGDVFQIVGATFYQAQLDNVACGLPAGLVKVGRHDPYEWDMLISGRRSDDIDPTVGSLRFVEQSAALRHGTAVLMPLLHWSDPDVFHFLRTQEDWAPDWNRYSATEGKLTSRDDKRFNPDWAPFCVRCLASRPGAKVTCPLGLTRTVANHVVDPPVYFESGDVPPSVMF